MSAQHDRAAVVALSILQMIAQHIHDDDGVSLRAKLTDYLRDEFHDSTRAVMNEIRLDDE